MIAAAASARCARASSRTRRQRSTIAAVRDRRSIRKRIVGPDPPSAPRRGDDDHPSAGLSAARRLSDERCGACRAVGCGRRGIAPPAPVAGLCSKGASVHGGSRRVDSRSRPDVGELSDPGSRHHRLMVQSQRTSKAPLAAYGLAGCRSRRPDVPGTALDSFPAPAPRAPACVHQCSSRSRCDQQAIAARRNGRGQRPPFNATRPVAASTHDRIPSSRP